MSGIPVKKLSAEDQIRIYRDLLSKKPQVKVDSGNDTLEDKLKQKEVIENKYRRRGKIAIGVAAVGFLGLLGSILFLMHDDKFAPYRKDPIVVEYLDKKQQAGLLEYEKDKILGYNRLERVLEDTAKMDKILNLQKAINVLQKDVKEKEGKKEVAAYNHFLGRTSPFLFFPGYVIGCAGIIGAAAYLGKNYRNKEQELKAFRILK